MAQYPTVWNPWFGTGSSEVARLNLVPLYFLAGLVSKWFNFSFAGVEKAVYFIPLLILLLVSPYSLSFYFFRSHTAAVFSGLLFSLNPWVLVVMSGGGHLHILLAYAASPCVILAAAVFFGSSNFKAKRGILLCLAASVEFIFDVRICFLTLLSVCAYVLFLCATRRISIVEAIRRSLFSLVVFGGLTLCFTLGAFLADSPVLPEGYDQPSWLYELSYQSLMHAMTVSHPFWGDDIEYFSTLPVKPEWFVIPLISFLPLVFAKVRKVSLFWAFYVLVFIFLVKGVHEPLGAVNVWIFEHVPFFSAFREPQKFFSALLLGYSVLFGGGMSLVVHASRGKVVRRSLGILTCGMVFFLFAQGMAGALTHRIGGIFETKRLPPALAEQDRLLKDRGNWGRVLWLSHKPDFHHRSWKHPVLDREIFSSLSAADPSYVLREKSGWMRALLNFSGIRYLFMKPSYWHRHGSSILKWMDASPDDISRASGVIIVENKLAHPPFFALDELTFAPRTEGVFSALFEAGFWSPVRSIAETTAGRNHEWEKLLSLFRRVFACADMTSLTLQTMGQPLSWREGREDLDPHYEYFLSRRELMRLGWKSILQKNPFDLWFKWRDDWSSLNTKKARINLMRIAPAEQKRFESALAALRTVGVVIINYGMLPSRAHRFSLPRSGDYEINGRLERRRKLEKTGMFFDAVHLRPILENHHSSGVINLLQTALFEDVRCRSRRIFSDQGLRLSARFDGPGDEDEYVRIRLLNPDERLAGGPAGSSSQSGLDLTRYPVLALTYRLSDPKIQTFQVTFTFTTDSSAGPLTAVPASGYVRFSTSFKSTLTVHLLEEAKKIAPSGQQFSLKSLDILPHKIWGVDCSVQGGADYAFEIADVRLLERPPVIVEQPPPGNRWMYKDRGLWFYAAHFREIPDESPYAFRISALPVSRLRTGTQCFRTSLPMEGPVDVECMDSNRGDAQVQKLKGMGLGSVLLLDFSALKARGAAASIKLSGGKLWRYHLAGHRYMFYDRRKGEKAAAVDTPLISFDGVPLEEGGRPYRVLEDGSVSFSAALRLDAGEHRIEFLDAERWICRWLTIAAAQDETPSVPPPWIDFEPVHPARYRLSVRNAGGAFWLIFNETFHPGWQVFLPPGRDRAGTLHVKVNGFANGWRIDPGRLGMGRDFELLVEFAPQVWFERASWFSLTVFVLCLLVLFFPAGKNRT